MTVWAPSQPVRPRRAPSSRTPGQPRPSRPTRITPRPVGVSYAALLLDSARFGHDLGIAPRQFGDPAAFPALDGILVDQIPPDAQRHRPRAYEIHGVHLIDTSGSDQRNVRE